MQFLYQLIAAALLTTVLMPVFIRLGRTWGVVDLPGGRRVH